MKEKGNVKKVISENINLFCTNQRTLNTLLISHRQNRQKPAKIPKNNYVCG